MSKPRDRTTRDTDRIRLDSAHGVPTDPGPPPEMTDPGLEGANTEIIFRAPLHNTPVGNVSEDEVDATMEAYEKYTRRPFSAPKPRAGANVANTAALGPDERDAIAYAGQPHSPAPARPTPPPAADTVVVRSTPTTAPTPSAPLALPEPAVPEPAVPQVVGAAVRDPALDAAAIERAWLAQEPPPDVMREEVTFVPAKRGLPAFAKLAGAILIGLAVVIGVIVALQAGGQVRSSMPVTTTAVTSTSVISPPSIPLAEVPSSAPRPSTAVTTSSSTTTAPRALAVPIAPASPNRVTPRPSAKPTTTPAVPAPVPRPPNHDLVPGDL